MQSLITDLLLLARCHAGIEAVHPSPVIPREILRATWARFAASAGARRLHLQLDVAESTAIATDPGKWTILVSNLLHNAISHGLPDSDVSIRGEVHQGQFQLTISNAAQALTTDEWQRMTEPFWRKDPARSSPDHSGLGLALVTALAQVLHIDVEFTQAQGRFVARLAGMTLVTNPATLLPQPVTVPHDM